MLFMGISAQNKIFMSTSAQNKNPLACTLNNLGEFHIE